MVASRTHMPWSVRMQNASSRLLTARETADRLGLGIYRTYQLIRKGQLPAVRLGRQVRVDPAALEDWIAAGGTAPDADLPLSPAPKRGDPAAETER